MSYRTLLTSAPLLVESNGTYYNVSMLPKGYLSIHIPNVYAVPMLGYISPVFIFFTVVFNTLVVLVLLKKHMRTATNALLTAMAVSDTLTGVFPLPWFLYYYTFHNYNKPVNLTWCKIYYIMEEIIPVIFHTASIWLTMTLAIQRYIFVCKTRYAKTWCSMSRVKWGISLIYIISFLYVIPRFFDTTFSLETVPWPLPTHQNDPFKPHPGAWYTENQMVNHCIRHFAPWADPWGFILHFWFRTVFVHFIPCTTLVILNGCLLNAMRKAQQRRKKLLQENKCSESKKLRDTNCTTAMLIVVVTVFLIVEIPTGVVFIIHILQSVVPQTSPLSKLVSYRDMNIVSLTTAFLIILSYPINFFIYCGMSKQFRNTFKQLFMCGDAAKRSAINSTRYTYLNGPSTHVPRPTETAL